MKQTGQTVKIKVKIMNDFKLRSNQTLKPRDRQQTLLLLPGAAEIQEKL